MTAVGCGGRPRVVMNSDRLNECLTGPAPRTLPKAVQTVHASRHVTRRRVEYTIVGHVAGTTLRCRPDSCHRRPLPVSVFTLGMNRGERCRGVRQSFARGRARRGRPDSGHAARQLAADIMATFNAIAVDARTSTKTSPCHDSRTIRRVPEPEPVRVPRAVATRSVAQVKENSPP